MMDIYAAPILGRHRMPHRTRRYATLLVALVSIACSPMASHSPLALGPSISAQSVAEATAFRVEFGLRSDELWVRQVELDPSASAADFGVRLTPNERAELGARARNADAVVPVVQAYGREHQATFGGSYIDQKHNGEVVVLVTDDPEAHVEALLRILHPLAEWSVRQVAYSQAELDVLHETIVGDAQWFAEAGIVLGSVATDIPNNRVELVYYGIDPSDGNRTREHFGAGSMLHVVMDRNMVAGLPRGALRGRVVSASGGDVGDLLISAIGEIGHAEPDGGIAYGTNPDGSFFIPSLAAMAWDVEAQRAAPGAGWQVLGSARVVVTGDATAIVTIEVP